MLERQGEKVSAKSKWGSRAKKQKAEGLRGQGSRVDDRGAEQPSDKNVEGLRQGLRDLGAKGTERPMARKETSKVLCELPKTHAENFCTRKLDELTIFLTVKVLTWAVLIGLLGPFQISIIELFW